MNVFELRDQLINEYRSYINSFINIRDPRVAAVVRASLDNGALWPDPLIQLNPAFAPGAWIDELVAAGALHPECERIFRRKEHRDDSGSRMRLHQHQTEAVRAAQAGHNYVLTTGTGSGKSLAYIVPIVDRVLRRGPGQGIQALVVYPMNALANSQEGELTKFLKHGYPDGRGPVTFAKYTGQEDETARAAIKAHPPDILLTNYIMLELILTRPDDKAVIDAARGRLQFLVLDELHTYRGRQGADVALLVRRVRDRLASPRLQMVGTSATLAGEGSYARQRAEVAEVATRLFGTAVAPAQVIGETLQRTTPAHTAPDPTFVAALAQRVAAPVGPAPAEYARFVADPLVSWLESTFGLTTEAESGRLIRTRPRPIAGPDGAAHELSRLTDVSPDACAAAIRSALLAGYECLPEPTAGARPFAFRLHQFISRGGAVYASLEQADTRYITLHGQQYKPGSRDHILLPLVFCRECGQEYVCVRRSPATGEFLERDLGDQTDDSEGEAGFLYFSPTDPWPTDDAAILERVPGDWVEGTRLLASRKKELPRAVGVGTDGRETEGGLRGHYLTAPFRFCLRCGVSYDFQQSSDFPKLAALSSEGRSTATTILSLAALRVLRTDPELPVTARKLLSFTDNRQDASLQAGHFNDFVEIGLLRGALYRAVRAAGDGLAHDTLTQRVFDALQLPLTQYASDADVKFAALIGTQRALQNVLGYRLYHDLRRGWRITAPNLEQCGLLEIQYESLDEVCAAEPIWAKCHPVLAMVDPATRQKTARILLDYMRRELAIKVDYLDSSYQERIAQQSSQRLIAPWALDENEAAHLEYATVLYPRPRGFRDDRSYRYLSPRGGFGLYLRRSTTFGRDRRIGTDETERVILDLLEALRSAGLVEVVAPATEERERGYQLLAAALRWTAGDGTHAFHDPIRVPSESDQGSQANPFFVNFYRTMAAGLQGLEAREHTAQVPYPLRQEREDRFRAGTLPILYCSPTMELGVDIAELNVVNLRNVPPTPANYAQRSGRAGRSGQPALVFTYCTTGSPHDQYFFKQPERMVAGAVAPPRLDLGNQDLVRSHIQAIWLAETQQALGKSLRDILDLAGEDPTLTVLSGVRASLESAAAQERARLRATAVLATLGDDLTRADWYSPNWLAETLTGVVRRFDQTCERWRSLYRAARRQWVAQNRIIGDASRPARDKDEATRLRRDAESQLNLLTEVENVAQSDFYSYRYFASEGFLPGYSFPRLPISAFIPARRLKQQDEFLSRPRFLAISEFGPRAIVYHEGSRYVINRVILPVSADDAEPGGERMLTSAAKLCEHCGYLHPLAGGAGPDLCEGCGAPLALPLRSLFRMQNVSTKRRDKISSDEEERQRQGYEIITGVRFGDQGGQPVRHHATVRREQTVLATLTYGPTATLWRINKGWARRHDRNQLGFTLDTERGYWERSAQETSDLDDPLSPARVRVLPYVEDRRNCLLLEPATALLAGTAVSLLAALKTAIQLRYQLEDSELATELLPNGGTPHQILFYESAEGGAGVLRRLLDDPRALPEVAHRALELCHFNPGTGADRRKAARATEECEAACYDCLMTYYNQRDHRRLDRQAIRAVLLDLAGATVASAPVPSTRPDHMADLLRLAGSELERRWLHYLNAQGLRLPTSAQTLLTTHGTRPDFLYEGDYSVAVYIDGPPHDDPQRQVRDAVLTEQLENAGYLVVRFDHHEDWAAKIARYPYVFGRSST